VLKKVTIKNIQENSTPKFVKTSAVVYERDGIQGIWETIKSHDSVHVLVDNIETEELLFVKQVRIPALVNNPNTDGVVLECCAGIVDKECSLKQIAKEEILEELGYDVPLEKVKYFRKFLGSVGTQATTVSCFMAEVSEDMKVNEGGGLDSEDIEVVRIPYDEVVDLLNSTNNFAGVFTDRTTLFLCSAWLFNNK